jgi:hypothetical protein
MPNYCQIDYCTNEPSAENHLLCEGHLVFLKSLEMFEKGALEYWKAVIKIINELLDFARQEIIHDYNIDHWDE